VFIKFSPKLTYLLLIPAPMLASEFLDTWFITYSSLTLIFLTFFKIHNKFSYLNLIALVYHLNNGPLVVAPETTVPILGITLLMRFIQNKAKDEFEVYPFFLWMGAFALFSTSFTYLSYIILATIILFSQLELNRGLSLKSLLKTFWKNKKQLSITAVVTILLFLFFPRFHQFLPSVNNQSAGEIGYSKSISNTNTANLSLSAKTAFYAEMSKKISNEQLYWRGRIHHITDGYNWRHKAPKMIRTPIEFSKNTIKQTIKYEQNLGGDIVLLDSPRKVLSTNLNVHRLTATSEFRSTFKKKKSLITAISTLSPPIVTLNKKGLAPYLELPKNLSIKLKEFAGRLKGDSPDEVIESFKALIQKERFAYSLKPGPLPTMDSFLDKKTGYCTHFASLMGMSFRLKNIPSRLVSGFQEKLANIKSMRNLSY